MGSDVLLDAGAVSRCRRRVHLEHDPDRQDVELLPPDAAASQRIADAAAFRSQLRDRLIELVGSPDDWVVIPAEQTADERIEATKQALSAGTPLIWGAMLPPDTVGHRRGGVELLVRASEGYVPILVVRHRITDPGEGALTTALTDFDPRHARDDAGRKSRSHPRDQLRLAHVYRMLDNLGYAQPQSSSVMGGVIGVDADVVLWCDLMAPTWPGGRSTLAEYDARLADRLAIALAAVHRHEPLAEASRIMECRQCPWWSLCSVELHERRDVSLVVRGDDAMELRRVGVSTVDALAALDPDKEAPTQLAMAFPDAVGLARAWLSNLTMVRKVEQLEVPRADVEIDVDMESFGDSGAYLWGCFLSGTDIGVAQGYRAFVTWDPLPTGDEARSFADFWAWFTDIRQRTLSAGLTFRAYCYNALAENRWLFGSVERFSGLPGIPTEVEVKSFVDSDEWVDLFRVVSDQFLCSHGKGLKVVAPVAGFHWRDPEASGEASMRWYRNAVGMDGAEPDATQRERLLRYNEDDVLATHALRHWITDRAMTEVRYMRDL